MLHTRFLVAAVSWIVLVACGQPLPAQQPLARSYDVYAGFADLSTPGLNDTNQVGLHLQTGMTASRWFAYGLDYSEEHGTSTVTPAVAVPALQLQLAATLPPGYRLRLPLSTGVQSFSAGGQLILGHSPKFAVFVHPVLAAFRTHATPHPTDPVSTFVAAELVPHGSLTDWYGAYGAGGGVELPVSRHLGVRAQLDAAWNHPFSNIIADGHWSYRYAIGPAFHFGRSRAGSSR